MRHALAGTTHPIHYLDATTLAALIRKRQLSSREVVRAHLDRTFPLAEAAQAHAHLETDTHVGKIVLVTV